MLIKERIEAVLKEADTFQARFITNYTEADFDDKANRVRMTVLREGTSHNGVHYTAKSLQQVKGFLETTAKKVYNNHPANGKVLSSRNTEDCVGYVTNTFIEGDELKADVTFFKDGPNSYLYGRMKENIGFGPSIIGKAILKKAKIDDKKVMLAEDIVWLKSFDIVDSPSAGGKVDAILESTIFDKDDDLYDDTEIIDEGLHAKVQSLKEKQVERKIEDALWPLKWALNDSLHDIVMARDEYEYMSIADRKPKVDTIFEEAKVLFKALQFNKPKVEQTNKKDDDKENVTETITESKHEEIISVEIKDIAQLQAAFPDFTKGLVKEAIEAYKEEQKIEETVSDNKDLTTANAELKKEVSTLTETKTELEKENKEFKEEADTVAKDKLANRRKELVEQVKKEVELDEKAYSDLFESELDAIELGEDEVKFTEAVKAKLTDRKELFDKKVVKKKIIEGAGHATPKGSEEKTDESELDSMADAFGVTIKK